MTVKPMPESDGPESWRWFAEADRETREAYPQYYWFHGFNLEPEFWWEEIRVSEEEYRANASPESLAVLDSMPDADGPEAET